jgi:hypothetical protein
LIHQVRVDGGVVVLAAPRYNVEHELRTFGCDRIAVIAPTFEDGLASLTARPPTTKRSELGMFLGKAHSN